jgi:hypothetical protein
MSAEIARVDGTPGVRLLGPEFDVYARERGVSMFARIARSITVLAAAAIVLFCGCAKGPPPVVAVSGVLLLDGKPLPQAKIEFVPDLAGHGAETTSSAFTDDQGRFTLANSFTQQPGAMVGKHRVLVSELPTPKEYRSLDGAVRAKYAQQLAKLANRPIPKECSAFATALVVEVTPDPKDYRIELKRNP